MNNSEKTKRKEELIEQRQCANCGARMDYIKGKKEFKCSYCGTETQMRVVIEDVAEEVGKTIAKEINTNRYYNNVPMKEPDSIGKKMIFIIGIVAGIVIAISIILAIIGTISTNVSDNSPPDNAVVQIVGKDILAGDYAMSTMNKNGYTGYIFIMEGQVYDSDNYVDSASVGAKSYVRLVDGYTISCIDVKLTPIEKLEAEPFRGVLTEGQYLCGIDFPAGDYVLVANQSNSYGVSYEISKSPLVSCISDGDVNDGNIKKTMQIKLEEGQYIEFSNGILTIDEPSISP